MADRKTPFPLFIFAKSRLSYIINNIEFDYTVYQLDGNAVLAYSGSFMDNRQFDPLSLPSIAYVPLADWLKKYSPPVTVKLEFKSDDSIKTSGTSPTIKNEPNNN